MSDNQTGELRLPFLFIQLFINPT